MQNKELKNSDWKATVEAGFKDLKDGEKNVLKAYRQIGQGIALLMAVDDIAFEAAVKRAGTATGSSRSTMRRGYDVHTHWDKISEEPSLSKALAKIAAAKAAGKPEKTGKATATAARKSFRASVEKVLQTLTPDDVPGLLRELQLLVTEISKVAPKCSASSNALVERVQGIVDQAGQDDPSDEPDAEVPTPSEFDGLPSKPEPKRRGRPKKAEAEAKVEAGWSAAERKAADAEFLNYVHKKLPDWPAEDRVSLVRGASDKLRHMQPRGKPYRDELAAELSAELSELYKQGYYQQLAAQLDE